MPKKEFLAEYSTPRLPTVRVNGTKNTFTQIIHLSQSIVELNGWDKDEGKKKLKSLLHKTREYDSFIEKMTDKFLKPLCLYDNTPHAKTMLPYSLFLQFQFTLAKPFISRDDEDFYIIENPLKKEKVFKVPMMAASGWKGNLRWMAGKLFVDEFPETLTLDTLQDSDIFEKRLQLVRIFGNENTPIEDYFNQCLAERCLAQKSFSDEEAKKQAMKDHTKKIGEQFQQYVQNNIEQTEDVPGVQGRLRCYPTFFDRIDLEVINPHDRKTRAGKKPIYFEVVPEGASGVFSLLWIPFDLSDGGQDTKQTALQADWAILSKTIEELFLTYGFSAKKTSGYGVIHESIETAQTLIGGMTKTFHENRISLKTFLGNVNTWLTSPQT